MAACAANMETYTIDDALTVMGFGKFQAFILVYAGMGWVVEAMQLMLLSFLGSLVQEEWKISAQDDCFIVFDSAYHWHGNFLKKNRVKFCGTA
ncbi:hypothetical protein EJB05_05545, partial [Eragrostis curvula]